MVVWWPSESVVWISVSDITPSTLLTEEIETVVGVIVDRAVILTLVIVSLSVVSLSLSVGSLGDSGAGNPVGPDVVSSVGNSVGVSGEMWVVNSVRVFVGDGNSGDDGPDDVSETVDFVGAARWGSDVDPGGNSAGDSEDDNPDDDPENGDCVSDGSGVETKGGDEPGKDDSGDDPGGEDLVDVLVEVPDEAWVPSGMQALPEALAPEMAGEGHWQGVDEGNSEEEQDATDVPLIIALGHCLNEGRAYTWTRSGKERTLKKCILSRISK
jgi:hypothetical protein